MTFTPEQDAFILMAHFRSGTLNQDGSWTYSLKSCYEQFVVQFPNVDIFYETFYNRRYTLIKRFETKHCICKGKSTGRRTVLTEEVMSDIKEIMDRDPTKSNSKLSAETGLSAGSIHKALKKLRSHPYKRSTQSTT